MGIWLGKNCEGVPDLSIRWIGDASNPNQVGIWEIVDLRRLLDPANLSMAQEYRSWRAITLEELNPGGLYERYNYASDEGSGGYVIINGAVNHPIRVAPFSSPPDANGVVVQYGIAREDGSFNPLRDNALKVFQGIRTDYVYGRRDTEVPVNLDRALLEDQIRNGVAITNQAQISMRQASRDAHLGRIPSPLEDFLRNNYLPIKPRTTEAETKNLYYDQDLMDALQKGQRMMQTKSDRYLTLGGPPSGEVYVGPLQGHQQQLSTIGYGTGQHYDTSHNNQVKGTGLEGISLDTLRSLANLNYGFGVPENPFGLYMPNMGIPQLNLNDIYGQPLTYSAGFEDVEHPDETKVEGEERIKAENLAPDTTVKYEPGTDGKRRVKKEYVEEDPDVTIVTKQEEGDEEEERGEERVNIADLQRGRRRRRPSRFR